MAHFLPKDLCFFFQAVNRIMHPIRQQRHCTQYIHISISLLINNHHQHSTKPSKITRIQSKDTQKYLYIVYHLLYYCYRCFAVFFLCVLFDTHTKYDQMFMGLKMNTNKNSEPSVSENDLPFLCFFNILSLFFSFFLVQKFHLYVSSHTENVFFSSFSEVPRDSI